MNNRKKVLLAFGEGALVEAVFEAFQKAGFQVSSWAEKGKKLPKEHYDYLVQLGKDPTALSEGTRLLLEKAKREKAEFILVSSLKVTSRVGATKEVLYLESLHFAETLTKQFHQKYGLKTAILRLPTIFGPEIPLAESGTLGHLILEFTGESPKGEAALTIYGEGKDRDYYLYLTDAAEAVKMGTAVANKEGRVFFATASTPLSTATIAEMLVEMGGGRHEIRYHKGLVEGGREVQLEGEALSGFKPQVSLKEGILQTLKALPAGSGASAKQKKWRSIIKVPVHLHLPRLRPPSQRRIIQLVVILLLLSPLLYLGGQITFATSRLLRLQHQIAAFNFQEAERTAHLAEGNFATVSRFLGGVPFFSQRTPLRDLLLASDGGRELLVALKTLLAEGETITTIVENLIKSYQGEIVRVQSEEEFNRLATSLKEVEEHILAAWLNLNQIQPELRRPLAPIFDLLQEGLTATKLGAAFATTAYDFLGYKGERDYLIFFQNSAEIWAGGGAVTSLAQLTLKTGGIENLAFFDHWDFSHVKGVDEALPAIFAQSGSSITRSPTQIVISPDFSQNARFFAKVFEHANGIKIDGVVGIDLHLAEKLLEITGPLQLTDFDKEITAENLFEVAETEVEKEFFPGSSKKKRFMRALGEGVLGKLFAIKQEDYAEATQLVWDQLSKKGILLYFANPKIYQTVVENGFGGLVVTNVEGDYLFPLDHNTGTKGTVWIKRGISYRVFNPDREGTLRSELTITWENTGTSSWPAGIYRNIFRVLVPKGVKLVSTTLGEKDITKMVFVSEEVGKGEFGIYLEIEPQTTKTLKLVYNLPKNLNLKSLSTYQLTVQKQPGTRGDSFTFTFEEPFGKQISSEGLQRADSSLIFRKGLEQDITLEVRIGERKE